VKETQQPLRQNDHHCIHTKNIYSLVDLTKQDAMYDFLVDHEIKCRQCSSMLNNFKENNLAIKVFVPKPFLSKDLRETFNGEVTELFKIAGLNIFENKKQKIKNELLSIDRLGVGFIGNLFSKSMIKAYVLALFLFAGLKYIL
jgi:transcriptional antiterminator